VDRFGRPSKGNHKGKDENLVGYARRNYLVPLPRAATFEGLNAQLKPAAAAASMIGCVVTTPRLGPSGSGSGSVSCLASRALRTVREATWSGQLAVAGPLSQQ
jgi:hypothetical protein